MRITFGQDKTKYNRQSNKVQHPSTKDKAKTIVALGFGFGCLGVAYATRKGLYK